MYWDQWRRTTMCETIEHAKARDDTIQEASRAATENRRQRRRQGMTTLRPRNTPQHDIRQHEAVAAGRELEEGDEEGPARKTLRRRAARQRRRAKQQKNKGPQASSIATLACRPSESVVPPGEERWREIAEGTMGHNIQPNETLTCGDKAHDIVPKLEEMPAHVKAAYRLAINLWAGRLGPPR